MSLPEPDLKRLLVAGLDGDAAAYGAFLKEARDRLGRFLARRLARDPDTVDDLVQDVLIAIHDKRATFDRSLPASAWIYAIARYKLIDHYRRSGRRIHVPLEDAGDLSAEDDSLAAEARHDVGRALAGLPERTRDLVTSVKLHEDRVADVAARTGMTETAVKVAIHRGVQKLAARLRNSG